MFPSQRYKSYKIIPRKMIKKIINLNLKINPTQKMIWANHRMEYCPKIVINKIKMTIKKNKYIKS